MSAEVPKLHRRVSLGDTAMAGDRPPALALVTIADPTAFLTPPRSAVSASDVADRADGSIAFEALSRFEYV